MTIIGVIGGVGPQAGLDFVQKIFSNTLAVRDQDHLNCMLISCPSIIPDRTGFLLHGTERIENPAIGMFESARRLYQAGVRIASVACNTAHSNRIFAPFCSMVKETLPDLRIINMLETCAAYVRKSLNIYRLGLLATKGTHQSKVYHEYFREEDKFLLIEPDADGQEKIHDAIYNKDYGIKANSRKISSRAIDLINHEAFSLIDRGAEAVILGCTELPLAMASQASLIRNEVNVPIIDPGLVTARRLIELTSPEKLVQN
jgi:aspartate racemase